MSPSDFSMRGAIDLGARKAALDRATQSTAPAQQGGGAAQTAGAPAGGVGAAVIDVTEATFNTEVVERSKQRLVVVDLWATWCEPCKQLGPVLEKLAAEGGGEWLLARVDVDANPRLAQALQAQSIPMVVAVVGGQVVHGFMGALPEAQVREWLDQLRAAIAQQGLLSDAAGPGEAAQGGTPDPGHAEAEAALDRGDLTAAAAAFKKALDRSPTDEYARAGLAQVELVQRVAGVDEDTARRAATDEPENVAAQTLVADLDMYAGRVDEAFDRLIGTVRRTRDEDRDAARRHLLDLFKLLAAGDPRANLARRELARALH